MFSLKQLRSKPVKSLQIKAKNLLAVVSYHYLMWLLEHSVILLSVQLNVHPQECVCPLGVGVFISQNILPRIRLESTSHKRKIFFASWCVNLIRTVLQISRQPGTTQTMPLNFYTSARNRGDNDNNVDLTYGLLLKGLQMTWVTGREKGMCIEVPALCQQDS